MATSGQITVRIEGLEELRDKLQSSRADVPVQRFLDRAANHLRAALARKHRSTPGGCVTASALNRRTPVRAGLVRVWSTGRLLSSAPGRICHR